jgi:hypothetical protein
VNAARLMHRPDTADGLRAAALELRRQGLRPGDIASALGLSPLAVLQLFSGAVHTESQSSTALAAPSPWTEFESWQFAPHE